MVTILDAMGTVAARPFCAMTSWLLTME
jgi:hypothetical protein